MDRVFDDFRDIVDMAKYMLNIESDDVDDFPLTYRTVLLSEHSFDFADNFVEELCPEHSRIDSPGVASFDVSNIVLSEDLSDALGETFPGVVAFLDGSGSAGGRGYGCLQVTSNDSLESGLRNMGLWVLFHGKNDLCFDNSLDESWGDWSLLVTELHLDGSNDGCGHRFDNFRNVWS